MRHFIDELISAKNVYWTSITLQFTIGRIVSNYATARHEPLTSFEIWLLHNGFMMEYAIGNESYPRLFRRFDKDVKVFRLPDGCSYINGIIVEPPETIEEFVKYI